MYHTPIFLTDNQNSNQQAILIANVFDLENLTQRIENHDVVMLFENLENAKILASLLYPQSLVDQTSIWVDGTMFTPDHSQHPRIPIQNSTIKQFQKKYISDEFKVYKSIENLRSDTRFLIAESLLKKQRYLTILASDTGSGKSLAAAQMAVINFIHHGLDKVRLIRTNENGKKN